MVNKLGNKKNIVLILLCLLCIFSPAFAFETVRVAGIDLPLMEGASQEKSQTPQATVAKFLIHSSLDEAINFYDSYFKENGFLVIGQREGGLYNVSAKKGDALFGVRIYTENQNTVLQFIW